jgi:hypothetical protein
MVKVSLVWDISERRRVYSAIEQVNTTEVLLYRARGITNWI